MPRTLGGPRCPGRNTVRGSGMNDERPYDQHRLKVLLASLVALLAMLAGPPAHAAPPPPPPSPEVLRLWPGAAPGTESWTGPEEEADADIPGVGRIHVVTNVTVPTITVFPPATGHANGTAMLVLPGGAFRALAWD